MATDSDCPSGESCSSGTCVSSAGACDPLPNSGCQSGFACTIEIPYFDSSDIGCRPAGTTPPDAACSPTALCAPNSECVLSSQFDGTCRAFCDLANPVCPGTEHCGNVQHPTIGICVP